MSAPSSPAAPEVAVGAIVAVDDHLLLVRRGQPPAEGLWSVPGGRVEPGEHIKAAVEREVAEETGLHVDCRQLVGWVQRIGPDYNYVILDFDASPTQRYGPSPTVADLVLAAGDDAAEAAWIPFNDTGGMRLVPGLFNFLEQHGVLGAYSSSPSDASDGTESSSS